MGPRALHSLGVAFLFSPCGVYFILLQFGSVSLRSDLGFEFRPLLSWISIFWFGVLVSLGELSWFDLSTSRSLSLYRLGELSWITIVDWAFANLFSQILIVLNWVLAGRSDLLILLVQFAYDLLSVFTFSIVISVALSFVYGLLSIDLIYMLY